MFNLKNKNVIITGAGGGIGSAIARAFFEQGATLGLVDVKKDFLSKISAELKEKDSSRVFEFELNLLEDSSFDPFFNEVKSQFKTVDILINNAGITRDNLAIRMTDDEWDSVIQVNLKGPFKLSREFSKMMMKNRYGRIISISSVVGVAGNPGQTNYCASKSGLIGMSKALARELATRGVTVNTIAPGFIESSMTAVLSDDVKEKLVKNIPVGYIGKPDVIAAAAVFLASDEASYITGQTLHVNGGMQMI